MSEYNFYAWFLPMLLIFFMGMVVGKFVQDHIICKSAIKAGVAMYVMTDATKGSVKFHWLAGGTNAVPYQP